MMLVLLCVAASAAGATTITVDWAGSGDYLTIQEGIDAAGGGDTVLVLAGTYTGEDNRNLDFGGTNMVLMSQSGYAMTDIDCEYAGFGFHFHSGEDTTSVVSGFTIKKAVADSGAGAFCENGSGPRFEGCTFTHNTAQLFGGGVCCHNSSPILRDCRFEQNTANQDGSPGGRGGGMASLNGSSPQVVSTDFAANQCYHYGGGLYSYYASPSFDDCLFIGNNSMTYGSGGGGAALSFSDGTTFTECTFVENGIFETIVGAGLHVASSEVTLTDCVFEFNTGGSSAGAHFTFGSSGTVTGCTFNNNVTTWASAVGGISCALGSSMTITSCTFSDNLGHHIWCEEASPTIEYSILAFTLAGGPVGCEEVTDAPHIHHCFVYGNAAGDDLCGGNFHDIVSADPLFCDRTSKDYTLCENSPCLPGETWPSLVGAYGQGCPPCGNATEGTTWGAIKAMYR
jgi:hypothetical protein